MCDQARPTPEGENLRFSLGEDLTLLSDVLPANYYLPGREGTWQSLDDDPGDDGRPDGPDTPPDSRKERP